MLPGGPSPYNGDKDRRGKLKSLPAQASNWYQSLPASQNPWVSGPCIGFFVGAQVPRTLPIIGGWYKNICRTTDDSQSISLSF